MFSESFLNTSQNVFLLSILTYSAITDIKNRKVSNQIIVLSMLIRLLFMVAIDSNSNLIKSYLLGGLYITVPLILLIIFFEKVFHKQVMGGADVKLIFVCGLYLGIDLMLYVLLISFFIASAVGIINLIKKRNKLYPFVPSLAIGVFVIVLLPTAIKCYNLACQI